jgi:hypothetical protein
MWELFFTLIFQMFKTDLTSVENIRIVVSHMTGADIFGATLATRHLWIFFILKNFKELFVFSDILKLKVNHVCVLCVKWMSSSFLSTFVETLTNKQHLIEFDYFIRVLRNSCHWAIFVRTDKTFLFSFFDKNTN